METSTRHSRRRAEAKDPQIIARARSLHHVPWCEVYECMISGMGTKDHIYAPVLMQAFHRARKLMHDYNHSPIPDDIPFGVANERTPDKLFHILGRVGARPAIVRPFTFTLGCNISVGDDFWANHNFTALDAALITIGNRVMFGPNVTIVTQTHDVRASSRYTFALPVTVEDDCWVGAGCTILPGVTLGKGCNIGAGAVVASDIPPATLAVGVPAKVIRVLTEDGQQVEKVEKPAKDDSKGETLVGADSHDFVPFSAGS